MKAQSEVATIAGVLLALGAASLPSKATAQVELSGTWVFVNATIQIVPNGPLAGDYLGVPLNADGRAMAATADNSDELYELNRFCQPWLVNYYLDGPFPIEFVAIRDPLNGNHVLGWKALGSEDRPDLDIWVDGRAAPPPQALHTWSGYAIGQWQGDTLAVSVTHVLDGWLLRNAASGSDQETISWFLTREQNLLSETFIIRDPVYLSGPYARSRTLQLSDQSPSYFRMTQEHCLPSENVPGFSDGYHAARYLPGKSPYVSRGAENALWTNYGVAPEVSLAGARTAFPEFRKELKGKYTTPSGYCRESCGAVQSGE